MTAPDFHRQLLDQMNTALVLIAADLDVYYINAAAQSLFELSDSRLEGMRIDELFPAQGGLAGELRTALRRNHPHTHRDIVVVAAGGQRELRVDLAVTPLPEEPLRGLLLEFHPLDRILRIARDENRYSAQQTAEMLLRGLAHEIKNPLGGVRGAAQLLERELHDGRLSEYTGIVIAEADRLRDLVDRMLGPRNQPALERLNVHEVLEHVCSLMQAELGATVAIARDYDPSLPDIQGDRAQLTQAALNIFRNAAQATEACDGPRGIRILTRARRQFTIGSRRHRLVCRVDIMDNGAGVPEALESGLFVPMVSGRAAGTGLGLAISQSIIGRHQGVIEYSRAEGWTVFTIYLPLDTAGGD